MSSGVAEEIFGTARPPIILRDNTNHLKVDRNGFKVSELVKRTVTVLEHYGDAERIIVYTPSLELVDIIKQGYDQVKIPSDIYSAQMNQSDNVGSFSRWREGKAKLIGFALVLLV